MKKRRLKRRSESGFTLIEMLLVMVIMGIMLAVIVPRAWRANVDAKYTLCRQNCTELAKYAQEWCESMLLAQGETDTSALPDYYVSLKRGKDRDIPYAIGIAYKVDGNWRKGTAKIDVDNRTSAATPETSVQELMPQDKIMRNPFNGASVFADANDHNTLQAPVTGSIGFTGLEEGSGTTDYVYYSLLFQGTDNDVATSFVTNNDAWHAGMGPEDIGHVRNGIFVARVR